MTANAIEAAAYEIPEIWEASWFPEEDRARVQALVALVPEAAQTLLDAGCGNGLFVNELVRTQPGRFRRVVGVDRSAAALRHVATPRSRAAIDALPFGARAFDVVTCTEVLEHLPADVYPRALFELARVAGRFILVTVPYRQDLEASLCRCPHCHARFNPDFHVRSFDESTMSGLLTPQGFRAIRTERHGARRLFVDQLVRSRLAARRQPVPEMPGYAICPVCGHRDADRLRREAERRQAAAAAPRPTANHGGLRRWIRRIRPSVVEYQWIATLYERAGTR